MPSSPPEERLERAMQMALDEARLAAAEAEVPVGAALLGPDGELLARDHNRIEASGDPTAHAERLVLSAAGQRLGRPRMPAGSMLAVTLEPCAMCAGALVLARVDFLMFGAPDPKTGACGSLRDVVRDPRLNHRLELLPSREREACAELLRAFFRDRRHRARDA
ncbi:MAG: hypothetical protein DHS20C15_22460 [Planctomycetota bacterium]|nr:MAG: hypothetical protein DHS20C15_22460 [Planctomycetota bacterium]